MKNVSTIFPWHFPSRVLSLTILFYNEEVRDELTRAVSGAINHLRTNYAHGCLLNKHIIMYMNLCLSQALSLPQFLTTSTTLLLHDSFTSLSFADQNLIRQYDHGGCLPKTQYASSVFLPMNVMNENFELSLHNLMTSKILLPLISIF